MAKESEGAARKQANGPAVSSGDSSGSMPNPSFPPKSDPPSPGSYDVTMAGTTPSPLDATIAIPGGTGAISMSHPVFSAIGSVVLEVGTVLGGRYEIQKLLGMGGMGAVYKARDRELDRPVGLKVIRPDLAGNPEILARFKQELILARQVTHRNIIRIFDLNEADGMKFITMEFVDGEDLRSILMREGKLAPEEAVDMIVQVSAGLAAAHGEGVIHRDLKPSNIMRDASGRVIVMDFGLARMLKSDGMTQTGMMIGTMEYMSPEQAMGVELDARSDIFALGLILYEALSGKIPFRADSAVASLVRRTMERATPLEELDSTIPVGLSNIVSKCLEREPAHRYASADQLVQDLEAWRGKWPLTHAVGGVGPIYSSMHPAKPAVIVPTAVPAKTFSYKWIALALIALVIAGGSYAGWKFFGSNSSLKHAPVSVLVADFENHTGDPVFDGTLEPMLNAALEGASFVNAFNRGEARKLASQLPNHADNKIDEQAARLIAASQTIGAVITGSLSRRGNGYKISIEAMNGLSGNSIATADATVASKDEVMLAIPKLAAPIRKALGDTEPESKQLAESQGGFTVGSLEAAHEYAVGMDQQFAGKWQDALVSFNKAVQLDQNFGRAYSGIAAVSRNMGQRSEAQNGFKMALAHVDRMTERERFRTRGAYYFFIGNYPKCIEEYNALVTQFPADNIGHNNLAICYMRVRNIPKALEEIKGAVEVSPRGVVQRGQLALYYTYAGDFVSGVREAREVMKLNPAYDAAFMTLADAQIGTGKPNDATATYQQLQKLGPDNASTAALGLAEVAVYSGRFKEAVQMLQSGANADVAAKNPDGAGDKLLAAARAQLAAGDKRQALTFAEKALSQKKDSDARFMAGRIFAEAGEAKRAREMSVSLSSESAIESQTYAKVIDGLSALQQKDLRRAIQILSDANKQLDTWIGHFDLGRAYEEANQFAEASSEFDICIRRRGESLELLDNGPTYGFLPPVFYYQGRVLAAMQNSGYSELDSYLSIRGQSNEDPLVSEARRLIQSTSKSK